MIMKKTQKVISSVDNKNLKWTPSSTCMIKFMYYKVLQAYKMHSDQVSSNLKVPSWSWKKPKNSSHQLTLKIENRHRAVLEWKNTCTTKHHRHIECILTKFQLFWRYHHDHQKNPKTHLITWLWKLKINNTQYLYY